MRDYLAATPIIDWHSDIVAAQAARLKGADALATARACFEFVRDQIRHSVDYQMNPVTCTASEVLIHGTGYCYAKSHLLAALLRANKIPAGLCYQRLTISDTPPFCLHGLNAIYLADFGWYRVDARGNKPGVNAQFCPPREQLAFALRHPGEQDFPAIYAEPLPRVIAALRAHPSYDALLEKLPDCSAEDLPLATSLPSFAENNDG